ncbi:MAG: lactate racemase domain-containing protein [Nitrospinota bacterium]
MPSVVDVRAAVREAIASPVDSPPLERLVRGVRRVVVVVADATRQLPQGSMLEEFLETLDGRQVTVLVGTGLHGPSPLGELGLPEAVRRRWPIHQHNARDRRSLVDLGLLGATPGLDLAWLARQVGLGLAAVWRRPTAKGLAGRLFRGVLAGRAAAVNRLWINRLCAEADLIVAVGQITPHFLTGYSGGIKAVVPGAAGASTIVGNHLKILHASARLGLVEGNVVRAELEEAVSLLPPIFIVNVVPRADGRPAGLVAGHPVGAHRAGLKLARSIYEIATPQADAVIVGASHPKTLNLYQLLKVLPAAARVVRPGGAICVAGPCSRGLGAPTLLRQILFPCYMEALLPSGVELLLLSDLPAKAATSATPFRPVASVEEAVGRLRGRAGPSGLLAVMDGSGPIVPIPDGHRPED